MKSTPTLDDFRREATERRLNTRTRLEQDQDAFKTANEGLIEGLTELAKWNDFARSLVEQFSRKGYLSPKQIEAGSRQIESNRRRVEERKAKEISSTGVRQANIGEVDFGKIRELFAVAQSNGLKRPKFHAGDVKISLASPNGNNAGALYIVRDPDVYQGKIFHTKFLPSRDVLPDTLEVLRAIAENPSEYARMTGKQTGKCCCCGRELTDPKSIEDGIGPICAEKWGL